MTDRTLSLGQLIISIVQSLDQKGHIIDDLIANLVVVLLEEDSVLLLWKVLSWERIVFDYLVIVGKACDVLMELINVENVVL